MATSEDFATKHPLSHRNAFVMMRFAATPQNTEIRDCLRQSLDYYGFDAHRADDAAFDFDDLLWKNIRTYMDGCSYGVAVFDQILVRDFNPNVCLELGYMLGQGKKCLVLKEETIPALFADLAGRLYRPFDSHNMRETIGREIDRWMADLHIPPSADEKLLVFVSTAGIDRCAMAKALLQWLLERRKVGFRLRIESAGWYKPYYGRSRPSGCAVIQEVCGADRLGDHRPQKLSPMLIDRADLILTMSRKLAQGLPPEKTYSFNGFFGRPGDVSDPAYDDETPASLARYRKTADELMAVLGKEPNLQKLLDYLEQAPPKQAPACQAEHVPGN